MAIQSFERCHRHQGLYRQSEMSIAHQSNRISATIEELEKCRYQATLGHTNSSPFPLVPQSTTEYEFQFLRLLRFSAHERLRGTLDLFPTLGMTAAIETQKPHASRLYTSYIVFSHQVK